MDSAEPRCGDRRESTPQNLSRRQGSSTNPRGLKFVRDYNDMSWYVLESDENVKSKRLCP